MHRIWTCDSMWWGAYWMYMLATLPCIPTCVYIYIHTHTHTNTHVYGSHIFWDVHRRMILYVGGLTCYTYVDMSRFIHPQLFRGNPSTREAMIASSLGCNSSYACAVQEAAWKEQHGAPWLLPRWILGWMGWKWRKRSERGNLVEQIVYTFQAAFSMTTFDCETRRSIPNATAIRPPSNRPSWVGGSVGAMFDVKGAEVSPCETN